MTEAKKTKLNEQLQTIVNQLYYCYNNAPDTISIIARFVDAEVEKIGDKRYKKNNHQGFLANDLQGSAKVIGNKIYIRYKGKDIATKCNNTHRGWKLANKFWREKYEEYDAIINDKKLPNDTICNIFKKFVEYKKEYDKVSEKTIAHYYRVLQFLFDNFDDILSEIKIKKALNNYIKDTKLSGISINNYLTTAQTFFNWASDEEQQYIPKIDFIKKYKQPIQKKIKEPYTKEEYVMIVDYIENERKHKEFALFIQFLWHTGARSGEALNIKINDIDFKNNYIKMQNKIFKGQQETLLLTTEAKEIIEKIIALKKSKSDKLFSWKSRSAVDKMFGNVENKLDIKIKGRGFHGFRRGFADKLFSNGFDMPEIQEAMRHKDIKTTLEHYKTFNKANIINKMNEKLK